MISFFLSTLIALDVTPGGNPFLCAENPHVLHYENTVPNSFPGNSTLPRSRLVKAEDLIFPPNFDKVANIRLITWGEFSDLGYEDLFQTANIGRDRMIYEVTMIRYRYLDALPNQHYPPDQYNIVQHAYDAETGIELAIAVRQSH